jgi:hypothetical protein
MTDEVYVRLKGAKYFLAISNHGKLINVFTGCPYYFYLAKHGYYMNKPLGYQHRLMAKAFIPNPSGHRYVDHINRDKTDNRIENLRWCLQSQNMGNVCKRKNVTSQFKGVHWVAERQRWKAALTYRGKAHNLGRFINEEDAARAYNKKAVEIFGNFANLNDV